MSVTANGVSPITEFAPPNTFLPLVLNRDNSAPLPSATPTATPTPTSGNAIHNRDFEEGAVEWIEYSSNGYPIILDDLGARSGYWGAWLGGVPNETSYIEQQVTVPAGNAMLSFYQRINSEDSCGNDVSFVRVNGTALKSYDLCTSSSTSEWVLQQVDLSSYAGQSVLLHLRTETSGTLNSNYYIDDVSLP